jgi:hypothetical protein
MPPDRLSDLTIVVVEDHTTRADIWSLLESDWCSRRVGEEWV